MRREQGLRGSAGRGGCALVYDVCQHIEAGASDIGDAPRLPPGQRVAFLQPVDEVGRVEARLLHQRVMVDRVVDGGRRGAAVRRAQAEDALVDGGVGGVFVQEGAQALERLVGLKRRAARLGDAPVDLDGFAGFQVFDTVDNDGLRLGFDVLRGFALGRDALDSARLLQQGAQVGCTVHREVVLLQLVDASVHSGCRLRLVAGGQDAQQHRARGAMAFSRSAMRSSAGISQWAGRRDGLVVVVSERVFGGAHRGDELVGAAFGLGCIVFEIFKWIEPVVVGFKRKMLVRGIVSHVPPLVRHCLQLTAHGTAKPHP